jgi:uncharacterized protein (DUF1810 family)
MERFLEAQDYDTVLHELKSGKKQTHWMWFVFPQIYGLVPNPSPMSAKYAIKSRNEAIDYYNHPVLGKRLIELTKVLLKLDETNPELIFGKIDAQKLQSSLTLFAIVSKNKMFAKALDKFFDGKRDKNTEILLE